MGEVSVGNNTDRVASVVEVVGQIVDIVVQVARSVQAENIAGTYNNTTGRTVVYNPIAFRILDN